MRRTNGLYRKTARQTSRKCNNCPLDKGQRHTKWSYGFFSTEVLKHNPDSTSYEHRLRKTAPGQRLGYLFPSPAESFATIKYTRAGAMGIRDGSICARAQGSVEHVR